MLNGSSLRWIGLCVLATSFLCPAVETMVTLPAPPTFDRYVIIVDRKPFGVESLPPPPVELPKIPPEQSFTSKYKMVAVTRDDNGVLQVGLVDIKTKQSVMLGIGDSVEGVEVVEADYIKERARLRRDPEDYWVSMAGGSNSFEVVGKELPVQTQVVVTQAEPSAMTTRKAPQRSSYAARREARFRKELQQLQAAEALMARDSKKTEVTSVASVRAGRAKPDAEAKEQQLSATGKALLRLLNTSDESDMTAEEINTLLQDYQKELIRSGQTPLPIPLTPETDQQLVNEGFLPPAGD
ncbi:MAG: hypothetical protein WCO42_02300 [bacterium]